MAGSETSPQKECVLPAPPFGTQITLQVGERRFVAMRNTLTDESGFFASLLSGRWDNAQVGGSYFIDADGDLFVHILRYLRRGIFPLFYDNSKGFDHALYLALLVEARYFQLPRLESWIKEQKYLQAVKLEFSAETFQGIYTLAENTKTDVEIQHHPQFVIRKMYRCPRGIAMHRGNPQACGRQCMKARGDEDQYEDEEVWNTMKICKRTVVDQTLCMEDR